MDPFIAGFNARLDRVCCLKFNEFVKGHLLLSKSDLTPSDENIVVAASAGSYKVRNLVVALQNAFAQPTNVDMLSSSMRTVRHASLASTQNQGYITSENTYSAHNTITPFDVHLDGSHARFAVRPASLTHRTTRHASHSATPSLRNANYPTDSRIQSNQRPDSGSVRTFRAAPNQNAKKGQKRTARPSSQCMPCISPFTLHRRQNTRQAQYWTRGLVVQLSERTPWTLH